MRKLSKFFFVASLLAASPVMAGNLTLDNGMTAWRSTQCQKPEAPESVRKASPETAGDSMNDLMAQHNAWVDAMQNYMNCLSSEADRDQTMVDQTITASAQREIAAAQSEVDNANLPRREQ